MQTVLKGTRTKRKLADALWELLETTPLERVQVCPGGRGGACAILLSQLEKWIREGCGPAPESMAALLEQMENTEDFGAKKTGLPG